MKKFTFELQDVLDLRTFQQEQAENELGKALAVEYEIQNNLNLLAQKIVEARNAANESRDFRDFYSLNQFIHATDVKKEALLNDLAQAKLVTSEKRAALAECMKKTTALEKLKEIQQTEYKEEIKKKQKKQLSELSDVKNFAEQK